MDLSLHGKAGWVYNYTSHGNPQSLSKPLMSVTGYLCIQEPEGTVCVDGNLKSPKTVFKHEDTFCKCIPILILNTWHHL
jgi:hypothetical protein